MTNTKEVTFSDERIVGKYCFLISVLIFRDFPILLNKCFASSTIVQFNTKLLPQALKL